MRFFTKLKILWLLFKDLDTPQQQERILVTVSDPTHIERDKRCLAYGRWEDFRNLHCLSFVIGLTEDKEYILQRIADDAIPSIKAKLSSSTVIPFTGDEIIQRYQIMETWCRTMLEQGEMVDVWINNHVHSTHTQ